MLGLGRQIEGDGQSGLTLVQVASIQSIGRRGTGVPGICPHHPGAVTFGARHAREPTGGTRAGTGVQAVRVTTRPPYAAAARTAAQQSPPALIQRDEAHLLPTPGRRWHSSNGRARCRRRSRRPRGRAAAAPRVLDDRMQPPTQVGHAVHVDPAGDLHQDAVDAGVVGLDGRYQVRKVVTVTAESPCSNVLSPCIRRSGPIGCVETRNNSVMVNLTLSIPAPVTTGAPVWATSPEPPRPIRDFRGLCGRQRGQCCDRGRDRVWRPA